MKHEAAMTTVTMKRGSRRSRRAPDNNGRFLNATPRICPKKSATQRDAVTATYAQAEQALTTAQELKSGASRFRILGYFHTIRRRDTIILSYLAFDRYHKLRPDWNLQRGKKLPQELSKTPGVIRGNSPALAFRCIEPCNCSAHGWANDGSVDCKFQLFFSSLDSSTPSEVVDPDSSLRHYTAVIGPPKNLFALLSRCHHQGLLF
jgi:hypothetical protein